MYHDPISYDDRLLPRTEDIEMMTDTNVDYRYTEESAQDPEDIDENLLDLAFLYYAPNRFIVRAV